MDECTWGQWLPTLITFMPTVGILLLLLLPNRDELLKRASLVVTIVTFALSVCLAYEFDMNDGGIQHMIKVSWIPGFNIFYQTGIDGISLPLVLLTTLVSLVAMLASWNIAKHVKGYCILFLLLETGMLGVFMALDFFLFYVFWEVMLLPMYFLIGIWGGPNRVYAAIKFFLYTLLGSVLILIVLLAFYFSGTGPAGAGPAAKSFDLTQLAGIGQGLKGAVPWALGFQVAMFVLLFVGFAIKVPVFPFHTWLPDAHVEAPTPISMILAGVLLKMGGYGLIRVSMSILPDAAGALAWPLAILGVFNIIYGAFAAMAQTDFKKLVAYSSISHMGYVILGLAVWKLADGSAGVFGVSGAMFQMIAHGLSSAAMFFLVGVIYDRAHHRDINRFGGLATQMPLYSGLAAVGFFAALGLPGLCGFVGEIFVVLGTFKFSVTLAVIAAMGVILTAGYILWTIQRVFLGELKDEYKGLSPITLREVVVLVPLLFLAVVLGIFPAIVLNMMDASVTDLLHGMLNATSNAVAGLH